MSNEIPVSRPSRGRPVDQAARAGRTNLILAAARKCFIANGFHGASTAQISAEAGISIANLYQYFPSKDDLILAMSEDDHRYALAFVAQCFAGGSFFDGLELAYAEVRREAAMGDYMRLRLEIIAESTRNQRVREALVRIDSKLIGAIAEIIELAQSSGELRRDVPATTLASLITQAVDGFYSCEALGFQAQGRDIRSLVDLLRHGISAQSRR